MTKNNKLSGILMYWESETDIEVFLVNYNNISNDNQKIWGIPMWKHLPSPDIENKLKEKFTDDTGINVDGPLTEIGKIKSSNKEMNVWLYLNYWKGKFESKIIQVNNNGKPKYIQKYLNGKWFNIKDAKNIIQKSQYKIIERLERKLNKKFVY
jgi:predicted NUDIX family NTP pyrophosphohydrolase